MSRALQQLFNRQLIWQARKPENDSPLLSGYPRLDSVLAPNGWPKEGLIELFQDAPGCGEWRLLSACLKAQAADGRRVCLFNPAMELHAQGLAQSQVSLSDLLLVRTGNARDLLWAAQEALTSGVCGMVMIWQLGQPLSFNQLRKLQLACRQSRATCVVFHPHKSALQPSPAVLRLGLSWCEDGRLQIEVIKQLASPSQQQVRISLLPQVESPLPIPVAQWPVHRVSSIPLRIFGTDTEPSQPQPMRAPLHFH